MWKTVQHGDETSARERDELPGKAGRDELQGRTRRAVRELAARGWTRQAARELWTRRGARESEPVAGRDERGEQGSAVYRAPFANM